MTFPLDQYVPCRAISISTLTTFSRCPRKYFYNFGVNIAPEEHLALKFGEAIHAALPDAFFGRLDAAVRAFATVWGDRDKFLDEKRNTICATNMLIQYLNSHANNRSIYRLLPPPAGTPRLNESVSEYEIPFVLDLGLPVPFVGRVDGLCEHRDSRDLFTLEFKTTSEMSTRFFEGFEFSPQVCGYVLAMRAAGVAVKGGIIEALKVSSVSTGTRSGKSPWDSMNQPIYVTDEMLSAFTEWAVLRGTEILEYERRGTWPRDISSCNPYSQFGMPGYTCPYLKLCKCEDWRTLKDMYVKSEYPTFKLVDELVQKENANGNRT